MTKKTGNDLFIVDNSDEDWKVLNYLTEWADISSRFDIATGYFEIGSLLALDGTVDKVHLVPALAPALKGNPFVAQGSDAAISNVIRKGRSGQQRLYNDTFPNMPSFGVEVVPDIPALVAYLKGDLQK